MNAQQLCAARNAILRDSIANGNLDAGYPFTMSPLRFPHPIIVEQIRAPQPHILTLFASFFVPAWLLTLLTGGLNHWNAFVAYQRYHLSEYHLIFLTLQFALLLGFVVFLTVRYPQALWIPRPQFSRNTLLCVCLVIPILFFEISNWKSAASVMEILSKVRNPLEIKKDLAAAHNMIWGRLVGGPSFIGVIWSSVLSMTAPVLEEMVFSGLFANAVARAFGVMAALLFTPTCFALAHTLQFGLGQHLLPLFFAGLTYTAVRFMSGSLRLAIFSHLLVNFVILTPKWMIAYLYFKYLDR
jgi:membrane protease YdiL (CAAX protease family)